MKKSVPDFESHSAHKAETRKFLESREEFLKGKTAQKAEIRATVDDAVKQHEARMQTAIWLSTNGRFSTYTRFR